MAQNNVKIIQENYKVEKQPQYDECTKQSTHSYTFEEAITLAGNGKFQHFLLLITGLGLMSVTVETGAVSFYVFLARCDLSFSIYEQGLLTSAAFFGTVLTSYPWGFLSDTLGRLKVIKIATIGSSVFSIVSAFSNTIWMLIVLRFIVGVFIAGTQCSVFSYLGEFHGAKTRTKAVTLLSTFVTLGFTFAPALAIGILPVTFDSEMYGKPFSSWRLYAILATIPNLVVLMALPFLPESPKYLLSIGSHDDALAVLRLTFRINKCQSKNMYPVEKLSVEESSGGNDTKGGFILSRVRQVWTHTIPMFEKTKFWISLNLLFQMAGISFVSHGLFMWFPNLLTLMIKHIDEHITISEVTIAERSSILSITSTNSTLSCDTTGNIFTYQAITTMGIVSTVVYIAVGSFIKRFGERQTLCVWLLVSGMAGIALFWAKGFYLSLILLMLFIALGNCGGIVCTIAVEYFPTSINALAVCLIMLAGRLAVVVGSNLFGIIMVYDCNILFYGLGSFVCILAFFSFFLPNGNMKSKEHKNLVFNTKL